MILLSFLLVCALMAGFALLYFKEVLAPLSRIYLRANSLIDPEADRELAYSQDISHDEEGEWQDLEKILERIRKEKNLEALKFSKEHAEFEALMGALSEPVIAISLDHTVRFFNSQLAILFGVSNQRDRVFILGDFVRSPDMLEAFNQVLRTGQSLSIPMTLYLGNESRPTYFALSISAFRDAATDKVDGAVGILFDVSDLKLAEQMRIEFVANVSHELRTPLTAIQGYAQVLKQDLGEFARSNNLSLPGPVEKYLDVMTKNVLRLRELVDDLLDLSSLESGADLKIADVSARIVTERAIEQVEVKRAIREQEVVAYFDVEHLKADGHRLEQVLINLIDNAIKYVPAGGRIEVRWEPHVSGDVLLRIKDNGPGIPEGHRDRLFERFYRVDQARSRETGGSGLGLSIVKHIMQKHGGSVEVKSEYGQGTEFICRFPQA